MTTSQIASLFEQHNNEGHKFNLVANKLATRPDLHAFMLLDKLFPDSTGCDMIGSAEHDQIWLAVHDLEQLTEENIVELVRCGVFFDSEIKTLSMFV